MTEKRETEERETQKAFYISGDLWLEITGEWSVRPFKGNG